MTVNPVLVLAYPVSALSDSTNSSNANDDKSTSSAPQSWHLSVFVFGKEYSYGKEGTAIDDIHTHPTDTIPFGFTTKSKQELDAFIAESNWTADNYDVLNHNGQHFTQAVLKNLGMNKYLPTKYTNLPDSLIGVITKYVRDKFSVTS